MIHNRLIWFLLLRNCYRRKFDAISLLVVGLLILMPNSRFGGHYSMLSGVASVMTLMTTSMQFSSPLW